MTRHQVRQLADIALSAADEGDELEVLSALIEYYQEHTHFNTAGILENALNEINKSNSRWNK